MASNSFGTLFRVTTFGESHGRGIGCVIDGCPAGLLLSVEDIQPDLDKRAPGRVLGTSTRHEHDRVEILSGVYEGRTLGSPVALWIENSDIDSSTYDRSMIRPGHADVTYWQKYGHVDHRGGGRASARETAARVAAGAVAKKIARQLNVEVVAWLSQVGEVLLPQTPTAADRAQVEELLKTVEAEGDSIGGVVSCTVLHLPPGLGDPIYEKLGAKLASAMLSIPASCGFEIGCGFSAASMKGSEHTDPLEVHDGVIRSTTNHSGGTLGGISTGMPIFFRVAFKPTSSIQKPCPTVTKDGSPAVYSTPNTGRHDPCVAVRAAAVIEAMAALVIVDALLMQKAMSPIAEH